MSENTELSKEQLFVKEYLLEYYRGFAGLELEYLRDFYEAEEKNEQISLAEQEKLHLEEEKLANLPPGRFFQSYYSERCTEKRHYNMFRASIFTIKLGGNNIKSILEKIFRENLSKGAAKKDTATTIGPIRGPVLMRDGKEIPIGWEEEKKLLIELKDVRIHELEEEVELFKRYNNNAKEKIESLKKEIKIAEERIILLENDARKFSESEKKITSEIATSSKPKSKTKSHDQHQKSKKKKSSTQEINKGKITEIPVQTTSDDDYLGKHFAEQSRDLKFYDFPAYWKDNDIYEMLEKVGYIERLEVKWNYKYRTVRARIRLTKEMEEIFLKGGSNIALTKNERTYFFRMFDAELNATEIKKRYEWQAYKKLNEESMKKEHEIIRDYNKNLGGHFAKIIKINKIKYILIYFNNESDLLKAIYRSTMEEDLGKGLQIKSQDELIGKEGTYKKRTGINRFKVPT
ncbi:hypothetical protein RirG_016300 [Rhizophagus irregularis DAOM 197198w]|uniref:Uncharacterized protein n=1 Tax=Rhizophagus irregularis (strain DAOM 197198w) TaxID=1432141 RepID=A0A015LZY8_RHIIW|nr:hypothetical protein RirG_016300 [Rhizophagus irregularis DAOM 197198w]